MYGNLEEIDVNSLLNFISEQQRSGIFFIENRLSSTSPEKIYFIFFAQGKIVFAGDKYSFKVQRLKEYLTFYKLNHKFIKNQHKINESVSLTEYEAILLLGNTQLVSGEDQKEICYRIVAEILFKIISLKTGRFIWQETFNLQPLIIHLRTQELLPQIIGQKVEWEKLYPYIDDIEAYPKIIDLPEKDFLKENIGNKLFHRLDGKTSFIQLSRYLNSSLNNIGKKLYPYIKQGTITVISPGKSREKINLSFPKNGQILYFSATNECTLKIDKFSSSHQYSFLIPDNLSQFFTYMLNLPIKLIILESEVENNYNTYNLCKIIRNNYQTNKLPILVIVNKYTFKDNLISKMYGVTEYIGEDIFNEKMSQIIDKY